KGGSMFMVADAATLEKRPAFDHAAVAASLSAAASGSFTATTLPFTTLAYTGDEKIIQVSIDTTRFTCVVANGECHPPMDAGADGRGGRGRGGAFGQARFGGGLYGGDLNPPANSAVRVSRDGKTEASVRNFNVFIRAVGAREWTPLSFDGSEVN